LQPSPTPNLGTINPQAHLNLASKPTFSSKCMVTPQISGLVNGDALSGLKSQGIECTTGDNTWAHLRNLANPYQMLYSNVVSGKFTARGPG
jgi:hypothetical protein